MDLEKKPNTEYDFKKLEQKLEQQVEITKFLLHVIASRDNGVGEDEFKKCKNNETRFDKAMNGLGWTFVVEKLAKLVDAISGYID